MKTMVNFALKRSVFLAAGCATFLLLFWRVVDAWDIGRLRRQHWRNSHTYARHPTHSCNLFRHLNIITFSSPLRQRKIAQLVCPFGASKNIERRRNNAMCSLPTDDAPQGIKVNATRHHFHRRHVLLSSLLMITSTSTLSLPKAVAARGLVHFPCTNGLANSYHFLRVGVTLLEEEGILSTNPLFLTNRDDALSRRGIEQVVEACRQMQLDEKQLPTLVKYSLAASCIDTAMVIGQELKLGTDRIIPEFTFLDPRGIGDWDMSSRNVTIPALWAMDNDEAGTDGLYALPPSNDDGTPHEVLADQAVRLRQLLSILESQYTGDTILLVFPDGTGPALLSAMIAGIPYNRVHELEYNPGEIRFDVTLESTIKLWENKQHAEGEAYSKIIQQGRLALKEFRATHDNGDTVTNLKDKRIEEERVVIENEYRKKQQQLIDAELKREAVRSKRHSDVVETRRRSNKPDIGIETALGIAASVGAGTAAWYFSSNSTSSSSTINATKSTSLQVLEGDNFSRNYGGLYSSLEVDPLKRSENFGCREEFSDKHTVDPKEEARIAMEKYLNRDDGVDDWLSSIWQILDDELIEETNLTGNKHQK